MSPADFPTFGLEHNAYLIGCIFFWLFVPIVGKKYLNQSQRLGMVIFLAVITVFQDIIFDFFQLYINDFDLTKDLPLHMCGLSLFLTSYALWTKNQTAFELSYFWGLAGAFQSIITPDPTRWPYGDISVFWNYLSHGLIILNVVWLIWVEGMRCRKGSLLNVWLVTSGFIFIMGIVNKIIGNSANYWFICQKPGGDSPFLIGEWPYYLITFAVGAFAVMALIYLPMWIVVDRAQKGRLTSTDSM